MQAAEIKILLLLTIFLYSIIVSQSFSYIISLRDVQMNQDAATYIDFRQRTDKNYDTKFRYVIYASLLANLLLVVLAGCYHAGWLMAGAAISLAALLMDVLLAVKGNIPINKAINTWTPKNHPADWAVYRDKWLQIFSKRQVLNITGFIALLVSAIFF